MPAAIFVIAGVVQGVGYRHHTQQRAITLGVLGWVRNLPDGRVECLAQGEEDILKSLEDWFWSGPPMARVSTVERSEVDEDPEVADFSIRR